MTQVAQRYAIVILCAALGIMGWLYREASSDLKNTKTDLATAIKANAAQSTAIKTLQEQHLADSDAIKKATDNIQKSAARARHLDNQLRMATNAQKRSDTTLSRDESYALCLRWLSAEGRLPSGYFQHDATNPPHGRNNTVAAFCAAWDGTTSQDALIWAGQLVDYAGRSKVRMGAAREGGK